MMASVDDAIAKAETRLQNNLALAIDLAKDWNFTEIDARMRCFHLFKSIVPPLTIQDERLDEQIEAAQRGDAKADACLRAAAAMFLEEQQLLPVSLGNYAARALLSGIPRQRKHRLQNRARDVEITMCVHIVAQLGFPPTRNAASRGRDDRGMSACAIVAKALARVGKHMSEEAIERVWNKMAYLHGNQRTKQNTPNV